MRKGKRHAAGNGHLQEARLAARDAQAWQLWGCLPLRQRGTSSGRCLLSDAHTAGAAGRLLATLTGRAEMTAAAGAAAGSGTSARAVQGTLLLLLRVWQGLIAAGASLEASCGASLTVLLLLAPRAELRIKCLRALRCKSWGALLHPLCQSAPDAPRAVAGSATS